MSDRVTRLAIVGLLAVIVGVPVALRPGTQAATGVAKLVILSPHNEQIRYEFSRAFNRWRVSRGREAVSFDWRSGGGASDLRRMVLAAYEAQASRAAAGGTPITGVGFDLFFGGGDYELDNLARGILIERGGRQVMFPVLEPLELPADLLRQAFPERTIGGARLVHEELRWVGVALSSFGIVYNRDVLGMLRLPEPTTWADLAAPAYQNQVALADPGHSGSIGAAYEVIVRRLGWDEGWKMLRRVFANARYFSTSAGKVPVDVSAGEAAAGMCIDFYGRFQAGAIVDRSGGAGRVGYVDPPYLTSINADPIGILHGAPNRELAHEFVLWLLTHEAQELWQRKIGTPDGPEKYELRRLPARRDVYSPQRMVHWADPDVRPFDIAAPFPEGMPGYYALVTPVCHAMALDIHDELRAAWRAIVSNPDHPQRERMFELFDAMPPELVVNIEEGEEPVAAQRRFMDGLKQRYSNFKDVDRLGEDRLRWTLFFRDNYRQVVRLSRR